MPSTLKQYILKKKLGSGGYGEVWLSYNIEDETEYAIKILKYSNNPNKNELEMLYREVLFQSKFDHPHIVKIKDYGERELIHKENGTKEEVFYIVLELQKNGDLFTYLHLREFTEDVARYLFKQLISGISEMHNNKICHRDLKPENLMLDEDFNLKIGDFGFAKDIYHARTLLGTQGFRAPEIEARMSYDGRKIDMFAIGVILFILLNRSFPFNKAVQEDPFLNLIMREKQELFWQYHSRINKRVICLSTEVKDLIIGLIKTDPSQRLTIDQIMEHPWFKQDTPSKEYILQEFQSRTEEIQAIEKQKQQLNPEGIAVCQKRRYRGGGNEFDEEETKEQGRKVKLYANSQVRFNKVITFQNHIDDIYQQIELALMKMEYKYDTIDDKYHLIIHLEINEQDDVIQPQIVIKLYQHSDDSEATVIEFLNKGCGQFEYLGFCQKLNCLLLNDEDSYNELICQENVLKTISFIEEEDDLPQSNQ